MQKNLILLAFSFLLLSVILYGIYDSTLDDQRAQAVSQSKVKTDEDINRAIKYAISTDRDLAAYANFINVSTQNGIVSLSGSVNSIKTKGDIEALARSIPGVVRVNNKIQVRSR